MARLGLDSAEQGVRASFKLAVASRWVECEQVLGLLGRHHTDQAGAQAGQGDERERTFWSMKFSRNIMVWARMLEI